MFRSMPGWAKATISAVAVAGAAGTALALAVPAGAGTGSPAASNDLSGYSVAGRQFRYVQATVKLPSNTQCSGLYANLSPGGFGAAVTLGPAEESVAGVSSPAASAVGISAVPSASVCGGYSPSFVSNAGTAPQFGAGAITLNPGDSVTLSLYYNVGAQSTRATVTDNTTHTFATETMVNAPASYTSASATAGFGASKDSGNFRPLWYFQALRLTTYSGQRGSFSTLGTATPTGLFANGHLTGVNLAYPTGLRNSGTNFGVRAAY